MRALRCGRAAADGSSAQPGGVAHAQDRPVFARRHALQEALDLRPAEPIGSVWGFFGAGMSSVTGQAAGG